MWEELVKSFEKLLEAKGGSRRPRCNAAEAGILESSSVLQATNSGVRAAASCKVSSVKTSELDYDRDFVSAKGHRSNVTV